MLVSLYFPPLGQLRWYSNQPSKHVEDDTPDLSLQVDEGGMQVSSPIQARGIVNDTSECELNTTRLQVLSQYVCLFDPSPPK